MITMKNFRFSLTTALVATAVVAVFLGAYANGSWLAARLLACCVIAMNATAVLIVFHRKGLYFSASLGFAVFGFTYLFASDFLTLDIRIGVLPIKEMYDLARLQMKGEHGVFQSIPLNSVSLFVNVTACFGVSVLGGIVGMLCGISAKRDSKHAEENDAG
jgi:hypothetical protein